MHDLMYPMGRSAGPRAGPHVPHEQERVTLCKTSCTHEQEWGPHVGSCAPSEQNRPRDGPQGPVAYLAHHWATVFEVLEKMRTSERRRGWMGKQVEGDAKAVRGSKEVTEGQQLFASCRDFQSVKE